MATRSAAKYRAFPYGVTIYYAGNGKGKTTAAIGVAVRAAGTGMRVLILQFIKGEWPCGERDALKHVPRITMRALGRGFVRILGDGKPLSVHRAAARTALAETKQLMHAGRYDLVVLDEVVSAVEEGLLPVSAVANLVRTKPKRLHLVITGHRLYPTLIHLADLVTEMKQRKHPFQKNYLAIKGIDY